MDASRARLAAFIAADPDTRSDPSAIGDAVAQYLPVARTSRGRATRARDVVTLDHSGLNTWLDVAAGHLADETHHATEPTYKILTAPQTCKVADMLHLVLLLRERARPIRDAPCKRSRRIALNATLMTMLHHRLVAAVKSPMAREWSVAQRIVDQIAYERARDRAVTDISRRLWTRIYTMPIQPTWEGEPDLQAQEPSYVVHRRQTEDLMRRAAAVSFMLTREGASGTDNVTHNHHVDAMLLTMPEATLATRRWLFDTLLDTIREDMRALEESWCAAAR